MAGKVARLFLDRLPGVVAIGVALLLVHVFGITPFPQSWMNVGVLSFICLGPAVAITVSIENYLDDKKKREEADKRNAELTQRFEQFRIDGLNDEDEEED